MNKAQKALFGLCLGHFMLDLYAAILIPLYPVIAQRLDINLGTISLAIGIGHGVSSIMQPLFGHISDKLKKRIFMFFGLIFASVFMPVGFIAPNTLILTLCLILGMAGNAFYHPQVTLMIKNFYKENQELSKAMGLFLGLGTIGYAFGPYISTFFLKNFKDANFIFIGIFGILFAFFTLFFVPKIENIKIEKEVNFLDSIKEILKNKICVFLTVITIIKATLMMSFGTYIPFLLKKFDFPLTKIGLLLTVFYIMGGIAMIISSKLEKLIKLKGIIIASYLPLLPLTLLAVFLLKINIILASIVFIITGFFILLSAGVVLAHAQNTIPKHSGTISGIIQGFTLSLGSIFLIPLGYIGDKFGVETTLILITSIAFISAIYTVKTKLV